MTAGLPARRTLSPSERRDWLRLARTEGVGPVTFHELLRRFGDAASALRALPELTARSRGKTLSPPSAGRIEEEIAAAERLGAHVLAACEPAYPPLLAEVDAPPPVLAVRGDVAALKRPAVAIVGARNASAVGLRMARDLARDLAQAGYVIVSGLARGVDAAAHQAAAEQGSIAVLAGGVDQIYPPEHERLFEALLAAGAGVSESPLGRIAVARDFPRRNRVISGLSLAVVVVEAAERSGSLITARAALDQGREVMAVPGSPLDPRAKGANGLIRQGALLVETAEDVVRGLTGLPVRRVTEPAQEDFTTRRQDIAPSPEWLAAVRDALTTTPVSIDDLARAVDAPHRMVAVALMELELAGEASTHVGGLASRPPSGP